MNPLLRSFPGKLLLLALALFLLPASPLPAQRVAFIRGADGSGGFFEPQTDPTEQLSDIFNNSTAARNHGWGELRQLLEDNGFNVAQFIEPVNLNAIFNGHDIVVFGSNNADYTSANAEAFSRFLRRGGGALFISDANFGRHWNDAPASDNVFLRRIGWLVNQDDGAYAVSRFAAPGHPLLAGVEAFDGEGVSPFTVIDRDVAGVTTTILANLPEGRRLRPFNAENNDRTSPRDASADDAVLLVAVVRGDNGAEGRVVGHFDRNTFFNRGGAGTNITRFDNQRLALNIFNWLAGQTSTNTRAPAIAPPQVFPNPFFELLEVVLDGEDCPGSHISVFNALGAVLPVSDAAWVDPCRRRLFFLHYPPGAYYLRIIAGQNIYVIPVIKQTK
jgi:hypothetical protein